MEPTRILIVDDDPVLVDLVSISLQAQGYQTHTAYDGTAGLHCLHQVQPDLVLLDIMMPGHNGWEVCRRVREMTDVPIIMLTAKGEIGHRLRGLDLGADDYVSKPFDMEELIWRVRTVLRRAASVQNPAPAHYDDGVLMVDQARNLVLKRGQSVRLGEKEMALLTTLLKRQGEFVSPDELIDAVWADGTSPSENSLKVLVSGLRRKIEDNTRAPRYIVNRRGIGYSFQDHTPR